jgi:hypothetical protein
MRSAHRVHIFLEMKQGQCICPLSWSVHCNFTGDGKCNKRGWACTPHPHQPRLILPSWLNVRQKADVTTLCTLWYKYLSWEYVRRGNSAGIRLAWGVGGGGVPKLLYVYCILHGILFPFLSSFLFFPLTYRLENTGKQIGAEIREKFVLKKILLQ